MTKYIVYSPGRTGSTVICRNINNYYGHDVAYAVHESNFEHSEDFIPLSDDLVCILSRRRNIFEAALSQLILERTNESTEYSNRQIDKFAADINKFKGLVNVYNSFYNLIDTSKYMNVIDLYYEDIFSDSKYLFGKLGIDSGTDYTVCKKSPYDYYKLITNLENLKEIYIKIQNVSPDYKRHVESV